MKFILYTIIFFAIMYLFINRWVIKVFARKWFFRKWYEDIQLFKEKGYDEEARKSAILLATFEIDKNLKYIVRNFRDENKNNKLKNSFRRILE